MLSTRELPQVTGELSEQKDDRPLNYFYNHKTGSVFITHYTLEGSDVPKDREIPIVKTRLTRLDSPLSDEDDEYIVHQKLIYLLGHPPIDTPFNKDQLT